MSNLNIVRCTNNLCPCGGEKICIFCDAVYCSKHAEEHFCIKASQKLDNAETFNLTFFIPTYSDEKEKRLEHK